MRTDQQCPGCPAQKDGEVCPCKLNEGNEKDQLQEFFEDLWLAITHIHKSKIGVVFFNMLQNPGPTLNEFIKNKDFLPMRPIQYFIVSGNAYILLIKFFFIPNNMYVGTINQLNPIDLFSILFGLSLMSWLITWNEGIRFTKVLSTYAYVYGTAFILNPVILVLESILFKHFKFLQKEQFIIVFDIPTTIYVLYSMWSLFKVRGIKKYKFWLATLLGIIYYVGYIFLRK
jgi:hypothetical protein